MLHFLCRCSYLFTLLQSFQFYRHIRLKSTAYFFDPPCSMFIVSVIVLATCKWLLAPCCSISLIWFDAECPAEHGSSGRLLRRQRRGRWSESRRVRSWRSRQWSGAVVRGPVRQRSAQHRQMSSCELCPQCRRLLLGPRLRSGASRNPINHPFYGHYIKREVTSRSLWSRHDRLRTGASRIPTNQSTWSPMNRFRTGQGPCRSNLHKWGLRSVR